MILMEFRSKMYRSYIFQLCTIVIHLSFAISTDMPLLPNADYMDKIRFKGKPVAPCVACQKLVKSFLTGMEETARKSFAGGDADWEKKRLGTYENSELRLIEIQEMLCSEVGLGKDQCYNLAEQYETELEEYFYWKRKNDVDLHEYLCINLSKVCCPKNTYGPNCVPCPGGIESPCGGHGKCMKGGTREEPATCFCDAGYAGELCDQCDIGYYQELDSTTLSCIICDRACKKHCRGPGPKNCAVCSFGHRFVPNEGCVEHYDDYKNRVLMPSESNDSESERKSSENPEALKKKKNNEGEELNLETNLGDSTVDGPHSEL